MRYLKAILFLTGLLVVGCGANAITEKTIYSENVLHTEAKVSIDDVKTEVRNVSGFEGVSIGSTISADVKVGEAFSVTVKAKESVLQKVITKVKDNSLILKFEKDWWRGLPKRTKKHSAHVIITLPSLIDLDVSGASRASVSGVNIEKLTIDISGASNVNIAGTARDIDVDLSGASSLNARKLNSETAIMDLSGASSAKVNVASDLRVDASGASSVRYEGSPRVQKDTSGASSVRQQQF